MAKKTAKTKKPPVTKTHAKQPKTSKQKSIYYWLLASSVPAILLYTYLQMSAAGFASFETAKYLFLLIIPIFLYISFKDIFK